MSLTEKIAGEFAHVENTGTGTVTLVRKSAFKAFAALGIPGVRHEEWKYTNIKNQLPESLTLQAQDTGTVPSYHAFSELQAVKLVFVNGVYNAALSENTAQPGLTISGLSEALASGNSVAEKSYGTLVQLPEEHFAALNTAFATDGVFIHVARHTQVTLPILIVHLLNSSESFIQTHNLLVIEEGAEATVIEDFQNTGSEAYYNHVVEIFAGNNANLQVVKLQTETINTVGVHTLEAELNRDARVTCTTITYEGRLIRNNINARLKGDNAIATMNGLYFGKNNSLIDNHLLVDHISPNCQSNQLYKGVLDDESTGVFNGKIFVRQDAQKTNAFQSSKAILLSENAAINSKPQLEIFADDVKCSHGAAIGQLGKNELFYLQARGIPAADAQAMLTFAFANEIIETLPVQALKEYLSARLRERLNLTL